MHCHTYEEVFLIQHGRGAFTIGDTRVEAGAGDIIIVPAGVPHEFVSIGAEPLHHIAIHATAKMVDLPV